MVILGLSEAQSKGPTIGLAVGCEGTTGFKREQGCGQARVTAPDVSRTVCLSLSPTVGSRKARDEMSSSCTYCCAHKTG